MKTFLPLVPLLAAGCAHVAPRTTILAQPAPTQIVPIAAASTAPKPAIFPAAYEGYYVGPMVDPDHSAFTYQPGQLFVQTRPERLRLGFLGETLPGIEPGPATLARMANDHPEPTATELAALVARSQRAIAALTEENESLRSQSHSTTSPAASLVTPKEITPAAATPTIDPPDERLNLVHPNADDVIELDPTLLAPPAPSTSNPFVQLYRPPVSWHDLEIHVSAAVPGPNPTAVIDDEPYGLGDRFKDLTVYRIDADAVYLRRESFLLACPVSERPLKLRLP